MSRYAALPAGNYTLQARLVDRQLGLASPQAQMQLSLGCDEMQGYLFGRPMPTAQFEAQFLSTAA